MELMEFQKKAVFDIKNRFNGRCFLAFDMGLGKTAVSLIYSEQENLRTLVICPASLRHNWLFESKKFLKSKKFSIVSNLKEFKTEYLKSKGNIIISYNLAITLAEFIYKNSSIFDLIIVDESHSIKNHKTKRTKYIVPVVRVIKQALLLSGTIVLNRPKELWSQLEALNKTKHGKYWDYARRFCNAHRTRYGWDDTGSSNLKDLNYLLSSVMIRETKQNVLSQLPKKTRKKIEFDITNCEEFKNLETKIIKFIKKNSILNLDSMYHEFNLINYDIKDCFFKAYSEIGVLKLDKSIEIIENDLINNIDPKDSIVIFCHHKNVVNKILEYFKYKYTTEIITGDISLDRRNKTVQDFQEGKIKILICSLTAASTGLTLTYSSLMYFVELPFNSGIALQAEDRIYRISQQNPVLINYLVSLTTLDYVLWTLICEKENITSQILDNTFNTTISDSDQDRKLNVNYELFKFYYNKLKGTQHDNDREETVI